MRVSLNRNARHKKVVVKTPFEKWGIVENFKKRSIGRSGKSLGMEI